GILDGLNLAWNLGIRKLRVQTDLRTAIYRLCDTGGVEHQTRALFLNFKSSIVVFGICYHPMFTARQIVQQII
ncbi:hypothetical protein LINPERHAP1_LOCUS26702, partial [Linum perenne]